MLVLKNTGKTTLFSSPIQRPIMYQKELPSLFFPWWKLYSHQHKMLYVIKREVSC